MKKLLLTTAIASTTFFVSNAIAQTTVSGNLDISLKNISAKGTTNAIASQSGFGKEAQINVQSKGKLNNGMDYAAGFSVEDDGNQTTALFNENTFIDFISGNTTLTISSDHIQNSDRTIATFVGLEAEDLTNAAGGTIAGLTDVFLAAVGANPKESFGVGIIQKIPGLGSLSAFYVPRNTAGGAGGDDVGFTSSDESAYEIGLVGDFGVKGLNLHAFYNEQDKIDSTTATNRDIKGHNLGVSYTFGQITAGYNYKETQFTAVPSTTAGTGKTKQDEFGLAYAATPNLTLAANYTKADPSSTLVDAKSKSIALGYSLGPVALTAQAAKLDNYTGVAGVDADVLYLRVSTKF
jgi:hypothetical protein